MTNDVAKGCSLGVTVLAAIESKPLLVALSKTAEEAFGNPDPTIRVDLPGGKSAFEESLIEAPLGDVNVSRPNATWHWVHGEFKLAALKHHLYEHRSGHPLLGYAHEWYARLTEPKVDLRHPEQKSEVTASYQSAQSQDERLTLASIGAIR